MRKLEVRLGAACCFLGTWIYDRDIKCSEYTVYVGLCAVSSQRHLMTTGNLIKKPAPESRNSVGRALLGRYTRLHIKGTLLSYEA